MNEPLMTVADVAKWLNIRPKKVYELPIRKRHVGRRVRYEPDEVRRYLAMQEARRAMRKTA